MTLDISQPSFSLLEMLLVMVWAFFLANFLLRLRYRRSEQHRRWVASEIERLDQQFSAMSERLDVDPLTGVYTRTAGERRMRETMRAFPGVIFVWLDLDDFGDVNKAHGWDAGDRMLRKVAAALMERFGRAHDTVMRYGEKADEFCVVLPVFGDRNQDGDPIVIMRTWAMRQILEILDETAVSFTYGICSTSQIEGRPIEALHDAQDQVRAQKLRRDHLRNAHDDLAPVEAPSDQEEEPEHA